MARLYIIILLLLAFSFSKLQAQEQKKGFTSYNSFGILAGEAGNAFQLQTINGWTSKSFFAGIGVGIDNYGTRSIPLFLDLRKTLLKKEASPFVYLDGGYNFAWKKQDESWYRTEMSPGLFYEAGIGYLLPIKGAAVTLSAGYSYKAFKEKIITPTWCLTGECPEMVNTFEYQLRRISIRAGFRF